MGNSLQAAQYKGVAVSRRITGADGCPSHRIENCSQRIYVRNPFPARAPRVRPPRDSDAQDGQFQRHAGELLRFLTRQVKCSELAADLRQETWLRFQRRGADEVGNLRAFLYRIARNLIIDHQRQQQARPQEEDVSVELASEQPGPEQIAGDVQQLDRLQGILEDLPAHLRQALLWNRLEGLTQKEIGQRLGVSESMAGRYILKALEHCQQKMDLMP
ncbi:sigma-70 family RNA polymerase sigma factor [Pseudomonas sp. PDM12]|nr:sigma-70 family RNA polymerase sigma factor [Pseudomonas sp. PDM12]